MTEEIRNPRTEQQPIEVQPINPLTYTTEYHSAKVIPLIEGLQNALVRIYCNLSATDEFGRTMVVGSEIALGEPNPSSFVDFDLVTKEQIDTWVQETKDYRNLQQLVIIGMNEQTAPTIVTMPLNF